MQCNLLLENTYPPPPVPSTMQGYFLTEGRTMEGGGQYQSTYYAIVHKLLSFCCPIPPPMAAALCKIFVKALPTPPSFCIL